MKLENLRVNHVEEPLGFALDPLSFSWTVEECREAQKQESARIRVYEGNAVVYDSGEDTNASSLDYPISMSLKPRTRYAFSVLVKADNGESALGESSFETGKMKEAWQADWITPDMDAGITPVLQKTFTAGTLQGEGRLYICGLGVYEAYLNGKKIGNEYLAPGWHSYDFHLQVQTYDVTGLLIEGENTLQVFLGDGWFRGRIGFDSCVNLYGDRCYCIAELWEGQTLLAKTDASWQSKASPVTFSNIYDGEIYDARIEDSLLDPDGWSGVRMETPSGCGIYKKEEEALLHDRYSLPVVKKEKFVLPAVLHTPKSETILDFGQNLTGWVEFDAQPEEGVKVTFFASEILQDGCFYRENLRTAKAQFTYISSGKASHVRPHFTFFGFRYMKVECEKNGSAIDPESVLDLGAVTAFHLRSDFDQTGWIETGVSKVNQLFSNALWGQKDNFLDIPTDCPQRDERLGWTGDGQIFSETACCNMYMPAFYRKFLWDMRAEQSIIGGSVPNVVPRIKEGMVSEHGSCPWADSAVVIPWNVYTYYGDRTLLAECYPGMKAWIDCEKEKEEKLGGPHLIKDGFHFADWLALDNPQPGPFGATDPLYIASAYYYWCTKAVADSAKDLGYEEDAKDYAALASDILAAVREKYFDEDGICICKTQTGSAIALMFDLAADASKTEGNALNQRVLDNGGHLNTGFVGTNMLCPALTRTGHNDTAVSLLLNEEYPGWLYSVNLGATTIWERWNSVEPDGHMNPEGMNSLNHYSYGSIEAWMYRYVCGISPDAPGFKKAVLAPHPDARLGFVSCTMQTAAGTYKSSWKYEEDGSIVCTVTVPFDAEAVFVLGDLKEELQAGTYTFRA